MSKKKKILLFVSILVIALIVGGFFAYDKATSYLAAKSIVEFGNMVSQQDIEAVERYLQSVDMSQIDIPSGQLPNPNSNTGATSGNPHIANPNDGKSDDGISNIQESNNDQHSDENDSSNGNDLSNGEIVDNNRKTANNSGGKTPNSDTGTSANEPKSTNPTTKASGSTSKSISVSEIEKNVTAEDKNLAMSIVYSNLSPAEISQIFNMLSGKLSAEETSALKQTVKSRFTADEIATLFKLYNKYMG